jgi:hypothetical protein
MKDKSKFNIEHLMTFGGVIAVAIATSYMVRTYLDVLRIKQIKKELNKGENE